MSNHKVTLIWSVNIIVLSGPFRNILVIVIIYCLIGDTLILSVLTLCLSFIGETMGVLFHTFHQRSQLKKLKD